MENKNLSLVEELKQAAEVYYQGSTQLMTDEEYDSKIGYLTELVENGKLELTEDIKQLLYTSVSGGSKPQGTSIKHDYPMLSLGKAKNEDALKAYHKRLVDNGAKGFRLEMKFDGLALSAKYKNGSLIQLATRGDGFEGELLNYLINNKEVKILGLPSKVNSIEELELRGEIYITNDQFKEINATKAKAKLEEFSNSRNAISGLVKRADKGLNYSAEVSFTAYSAYKKGEQVSFDELKLLDKSLSKASDLTEREIKRLSTDEVSLSSSIVDSVDFDELMSAVVTFGNLRPNFKIPTDGVVIKPTNEIEMLNKMGFTAHHPVAYIAYKYKGASAYTEVLDITLSVGKTGRVTPKASIKPVEVDGVVIRSATCHNFSWMKNKGIKIGSQVTVVRANDVIPAIDTVVIPGDGPEFKIPQNCPECGGLLVGKGEVDKGTSVHKTLQCSSKKCPSKNFYYIKSIVGRNYLDIDGLGDVALETLVGNGTIRNIVDLYTVSEDTLAKTVTGLTSTGSPRMLGEGNAKNIMKSINDSKENTESYKLLASLNIPELGKSHSKKLVLKFGGIKKVLELTEEELYKVDGVGSSLVDSFLENREEAKTLLNKIIDLGFKINDPEVSNVKEKKGSFSVSGSVEGFSNRDEFVEYMENNGWEFHKSPKKDTTLLFADPDSTSSKVLKAKKNGTKIVNRVEDI